MADGHYLFQEADEPMSPITQREFRATTRPRSAVARAFILTFSLFATPLITMTFSTSANAELYKWVDENGKVHFTDKPVHPSAQTIEVEQQKMIGQDEDVRGINDRIKRLRQSESEVQAIEDKARLQKKDQADKLSKRCVSNKHRLSRLNGLVYRVNDKGERVYMTDDEILQTRAKLQQWIDDNC
jgi:uncharacterized protein DUF4124